MKKTITLGGKEYSYFVNFKMSYNFLKFRNRISKGFDFATADKKVVEEILLMQEEIRNSADKNDLSFLEKLSPEAIKFLKENQKINNDIFTQEEIVEIVSVFTNEKEEEKIFEILDKEIEQEGFDNLIGKLIEAISEVFMNAKETL